MPIYEYRCPNGHTFELFQRMSDLPPSECQICAAEPVEKVLYPVAVHFKGSGFYSTDYGRGGRKREDSRDGESPGEPKTDEKKDEKKADEKKPKTDKKAAEA